MTRGDVCELKPARGARGHEQRGERFCVVLQAPEFAGLSTLVVAPTSRSTPESLLRPEVQVRERSTRVLVQQIRAVDHSRLGKRVGRLTAEETLEVDEALRLLLGLW